MTERGIDRRKYMLIDENRYGWWSQWAYCDDRNRAGADDKVGYFSLEGICKHAGREYKEFPRTFYKHY